MLAPQQPPPPLLDRLPPEARLVAHLDAVARHQERERRDALRLREPAPDAPARPARERQERVARVVAEEARGFERSGVVQVARCGGRGGAASAHVGKEERGDVGCTVVVQRGHAEGDAGAARDGDRRLLARRVRHREDGILRALLGDVDDGREPA